MTTPVGSRRIRQPEPYTPPRLSSSQRVYRSPEPSGSPGKTSGSPGKPIFASDVADAFRAKFTRVEQECEQEERNLKLLQAEYLKISEERAQQRKELDLAEQNLRATTNALSAANKARQDLEGKLTAIAAQIEAAKNTKLNLILLLERQKEQSVLAQGTLQRYCTEKTDITSKLDAFEREKASYDKANRALMDEILGTMDSVTATEARNSSLDEELGKLRAILGTDGGD